MIKRFSEDRVNVINDDRQPLMSRTKETSKKVHQIVHINHKLPVRNTAEEVKIGREKVKKFN